MAVKIRLARGGTKKRPFYRVVVADVRAPRDGKFIEKLGTYNPLLPKDNESRIVLNGERITYWLEQGAVPSERVEKFLVDAKLYERSKKRQQVLDQRIAKSQEAAKLKAEEAAKKQAEKEAQEKAKAEEAAAAAAAEAEAQEAPAEDAQQEAEAQPAETASEEAPAEEAQQAEEAPAEAEEKTE